MTHVRKTTGLVVAALAVTSATAVAEGSTEVGVSQGLSSTTTLMADVTDTESESLLWVGAGEVTVMAPDGELVSGFDTGDGLEFALDGLDAGAYEVTLDRDQFESDAGRPVEFHDWDLSVTNGDGIPIPGRVWAYTWSFQTGSFAQSTAANTSFYGLASGGDDSNTAVVELRFEGLSGSNYVVFANRRGPRVPGDSAFSGRSIFLGEGGTFVLGAEIPLYLHPPEAATYSFVEPTITSAAFDGGEDTVSCNAIGTAGGSGAFLVDTDVEGVAHVACDLDDSGTAELTDPDDLVLIGAVTAEDGTVAWDGLGRDGVELEPGEYTCRTVVAVGEVHYVAVDIETIFPGLRMFEVQSAEGARAPLSMFWDDSEVAVDPETEADRSVVLPGDTTCPESVDATSCGRAPVLPPEGGLSSGEPAGEAVPYGAGGTNAACDGGNARAWGAFCGSEPRGRGDVAQLDTFTWLSSAVSEPFTVRVLNEALDTDDDDLTDLEEECVYGTEPTERDSDHDGLTDGEEIALGLDPLDPEDDSEPDDVGAGDAAEADDAEGADAEGADAVDGDALEVPDDGVFDSDDEPALADISAEPRPESDTTSSGSAPGPTADSGCSCTSSGGTPPGAVVVAIFALVAATYRRRRNP